MIERETILTEPGINGENKKKFDQLTMIQQLKEENVTDRRIVYELIGEKVNSDDDFEDAEVQKKAWLRTKGSWVNSSAKSMVRKSVVL